MAQGGMKGGLPPGAQPETTSLPQESNGMGFMQQSISPAQSTMAPQSTSMPSTVRDQSGNEWTPEETAIIRTATTREEGEAIKRDLLMRKMEAGASGEDISGIVELARKDPSIIEQLAPSQRTAVYNEIAKTGGFQEDPGQSGAQIGFLLDTVGEAKKLSHAAGRSPLKEVPAKMLFGATDKTRLEALTNTLRTNVLTLMTDPDIKKFFGPQMSEADVRLMTAGGTTLNPDLQSPEDMKLELSRLEDLLTRMVKAVPKAGGEQGGFVPGGAATPKTTQSTYAVGGKTYVQGPDGLYYAQ